MEMLHKATSIWKFQMQQSIQYENNFRNYLFKKSSREIEKE